MCDLCHCWPCRSRPWPMISNEVRGSNRRGAAAVVSVSVILLFDGPVSELFDGGLRPHRAQALHRAHELGADATKDALLREFPPPLPARCRANGERKRVPGRHHDSDIAVPRTLRLSRAISSADWNPVVAGTNACFGLLGDNGPAFCTTGFPFLPRVRASCVGRSVAARLLHAVQRTRAPCLSLA
jgi:hypothetical protein